MKNPFGVLCLLIGTILVALGVLLPFYSIGGESTNLFNIIRAIWPIAGLVALVVGFVGNKVVALICSLISGGGLLLAFFVNSGSETSKLLDVVGGSKGLGYWCSLIGGIVMILAGVINFITTKTDKEA